MAAPTLVGSTSKGDSYFPGYDVSLWDAVIGDMAVIVLFVEGITTLPTTWTVGGPVANARMVASGWSTGRTNNIYVFVMDVTDNFAAATFTADDGAFSWLSSSESTWRGITADEVVAGAVTISRNNTGFVDVGAVTVEDEAISLLLATMEFHGNIIANVDYTDIIGNNGNEQIYRALPSPGDTGPVTVEVNAADNEWIAVVQLGFPGVIIVPIIPPDVTGPFEAMWVDTDRFATWEDDERSLVWADTAPTMSWV